MGIDANKTGETRRVTELAASWLGERGFKPVESEVPVADGWVADIAGCASLSRTEAINMKLIRRKPTWDKDWVANNQRWEADFASLPSIITAAIEVKTSRSDFTRDKKWLRLSPVHLLYLASPPKLIKPEEVPDWIGLIVCGECGPRTIRPAACQQLDWAQVANVVHAIAIRRDHFTAYQRWREFSRQARERDNERTNKASVYAMVSAAVDVVTGKRTPEEALKMHGIKTGRLRAETVETLRRLVAPVLNESR